MTREFTPLHRAPAGGEYYVFRDAVHNLIEIDDADEGIYIRNLLGTAEVQRLRRIRQNGLNFLVYQSQETSRFPHSLGAFHVARRLSNSLSERQPSLGEGFPVDVLGIHPRDRIAFSAAALLHDIGHGPLSHTWEEIWAKARGKHNFHEEIGWSILSDPGTGIGQLLSNPDVLGKYPNIGDDIRAFISNKHRLNYLHPLLSGNLDIDRLDFMARDTRSAGVNYGFHDLEWIIRSFRFALLPDRFSEEGPQWIIAIDARKGLSTLFQFLNARENMYHLVYHHKTTRAATKMLELLFKRATVLARKGQLAGPSVSLNKALSGSDITASDLLDLDDSDVWFSLKQWAKDAPDTILRNLSSGIVNRDLYKVFLLSPDVFKHLNDVDTEQFGRMLARTVAARLRCTLDEAQYYYGFDEIEFDVVGRKADRRVDEVWIMEAGSLGFQYKTLRDYWKNEVGSKDYYQQHLLVVHQSVVDDLAPIVERLSFPAASAERLGKLPSAPAPYKVLAPLGAEGAWKEVYVASTTQPGTAPEMLVALKLYKRPEIAHQAAERDVHTLNLLGGLLGTHPNLVDRL